jgi:hypothetical protein
MDYSAKLSPQTRELLSKRGESAESDEQVDVLIRCTDDPAVRESLEQRGVSVRTVAGDVVSAAAPVSALEALAELPEVQSIEVSTPLYGEESPPTG